MRLNEHRKLLQKQHADLRALLRQLPNDNLTEEVSQLSIDIRAIWRQALKDSIEVCRTLSERVHVLNLRDYARALAAAFRLQSVCQEVEKTLSTVRIQHD